MLGKAPPEGRKAIGEKVNALKQEVEAGFETCLRELRKKEREAELSAPPFDLTLPGRVPVALGHKHPISIVREEVVAVFRQLGFAVHDGPEIEHEANNFTLLGFPPDHPATDMQDSFWTHEEHLLRTHTSQHPDPRDEVAEAADGLHRARHRVPPRRRRDALADVPPDRGVPRRPRTSRSRT